MKHIWEQAILMGIGSKREVNAERVLFFFEDTVCVYPAQSFSAFEYNSAAWKRKKFWTDFNKGDGTKFVIERNAKNYFGADDGEKYVTYYTPINQDGENALDTSEGVIGLQLKQSDYD